ADALPFTPDQLAGVVHALLLQLPAWAAWCRGEDWRAGLEGKSSYLCHQLATVMLACEWMAAAVLSAGERTESQQAGPGAVRARDALVDDALMEVRPRAYAVAWRGRVSHLVRRPGERTHEPLARTPDVQAAFGIDVRSQWRRRDLGSESPKVDTLGVG